MDIDVRREYTLTCSVRELTVIKCALELVATASTDDLVKTFGDVGISHTLGYDEATDLRESIRQYFKALWMSQFKHFM